MRTSHATLRSSARAHLTQQHLKCGATCTLQVMKLRRRFDDLSEQVARLTQQRELLLTQMADDQAQWEKRQQVGADAT